MVKLNGVYRHYKGNIYKVIAFAKHSETLEDLVIYQDSIDESKIWARPLTMWEDEITVNSQVLKRFVLLK